MNKKEKKELYISSFFMVIFIILGLIAVHFGFKIHNKIKTLRKYGIKTHGTIIRYERHRGNKPNETFVLPVVLFYTNSGEKIIFEGHINNSSFLKNICKTGEEVEVIYNPNAPKDAMINSFAEIWFFPLLLWVIGFGFIVVPPFTIWKYYREKGLI